MSEIQEKINRLSTLSDFPYHSGIQVIKDSLNFTNFDEFYRHIIDSLPQNSPGTRRRYAGLIVRCFFPEHQLDSLLPQVWKAYHDEQILHELTRITTLEAEPVIAKFVTDVILALNPGEIFQTSLAKDYIIENYGVFKMNSYKRLLNTVRHLGFLSHFGMKWIVTAIPRPANSLLFLLHSRFAPTPRIVRVADLFAQEFWRYLGIREMETVRTILQDAQAARLIARYSVVDQLEQITTLYTIDEYINRALRF